MVEAEGGAEREVGGRSAMRFLKSFLGGKKQLACQAQEMENVEVKVKE